MRNRGILVSMAALVLSFASGCGGRSSPPAQQQAAAAPQLAPGAGTYTSPQTVTITDATSGAAIHYTTDGSAPTASSAQYSGPIGVASTTTIQAIATASGYTNSAVSAAIYTITPHQAASYYVAPSGNDAWPGTEAQPFATIQFAVGRLMAGDTLNIRAGDYHETVSVRQSGTAAAPITIQAYPGECPNLIGATVVAGPWTVYAGAIYTAAWPSQPTQVFGAGHLLNEARWPNTAIEDFANMTYALADSGNQNYVTYSTLPNVDLTGAWVRVMAGQAWVAYDRQVASHDRASGTLTFSSPIDAMTELVPRRGSHFFVFGKLNLLDAPGEWWWDPAQQRLYVWMPDGASPEGRVEAGIAPAVLDLSGQSYVTVKGLAALGGWFNLQNSTNCTLQDFSLWAPNWVRTFDGYDISPQYLGGVDVSGSGNLIDGGSVQQAGRSGIHVAGSGNTVQQVTVQDSGWNWTAEAAINLSGASQALVQNNTVSRTEGEGIVLAPQSRVLNNLVENACMFVEDCGNVNSWSMDGQGTEIAYNILQGNHSRWGAAIYLDAGSRNFRLHDNLAEGMAWNGVNITDVNDVENNTFVDVGHQGISYVPGATAVGADWSAGQALHPVGRTLPALRHVEPARFDHSRLRLLHGLYASGSSTGAPARGNRLVPTGSAWMEPAAGSAGSISGGRHRFWIRFSDRQLQLHDRQPAASSGWCDRGYGSCSSHWDCLDRLLVGRLRLHSYRLRPRHLGSIGGQRLRRSELSDCAAAGGFDGSHSLPRAGLRAGGYGLAQLQFPGIPGRGQRPRCGPRPRRHFARFRGRRPVLYSPRLRCDVRSGPQHSP